MNRRDWPWWVLAAVAWVVGAWLRLWQLGDQILLDDEWHAIHRLREAGWREIATHFGRADYSIPLTLYDRWLYVHGLLTETMIRLPMVLAGLVLLSWLPFALRRHLPLAVRSTATALLAISPMLVCFDRYARPYALTTLLTGVAVIAIHGWWRERPAPRWRAALYIATATLAAWLHLLSLVFTLMPFVAFAAEAIWRAREPAERAEARRAFRRLVLLASLTLLPLLAALLPPLIGDFEAMRVKTGAGSPSAWHAWLTMLMAFGTGHHLVGAALLATAAFGAWRWMRRDTSFTLYLLFVAAAGTLLIVTSRPAWIQHPGVLARYAVPVLPLLLMWTAEGALALLSWILSPWLRVAAVAALVALLIALGPLPAMLYAPNQFMSHYRFQYDYDPARMRAATGMEPGPIPVFYHDLARLPARSVTVVEAPWRLEPYLNPVTWYQQLDRQYRRMGLVVGTCATHEWGDWPESDAGMRLHMFVHLSAILRGEDVGADYLVLHLRPWGGQSPEAIGWPDVSKCLALAEARLGLPIYRDDDIVAFAIGRGRHGAP